MTIAELLGAVMILTDWDEEALVDFEIDVFDEHGLSPRDKTEWRTTQASQALIDEWLG